MVYAVKSVNNKEFNTIYDNWSECKTIVYGKNAIYKSFPSREEAQIFLSETVEQNEVYGNEYIPEDINRKVIYVKYKFDRCKEKENGFSVRIYEDKNKKHIPCKGFYLPSNEKILYEFTGKFVKNDKYGYEFIVENYKEHIVDTKDSIVTYLSSGVIKGIGPKRANDIYKKFGSRTLEIIENTPDRLLQVRGISQKSLSRIKESYAENRGAREIVSYLLPYGITPQTSTKFYNIYGKSSIDKIKENPYILCSVKGLSFLDAERVATDLQVASDFAPRFYAAAYYVLKWNETESSLRGSTGMELQSFGYKMEEILGSGVTRDYINKKTCEMVKNKNLRVHRFSGKQYIFSAAMYDQSYSLATRIISLRDETIRPVDKDVLNFAIKNIEDGLGYEIDSIQREAVITVMSNHITVITGSPGTGKTTSINTINKCYMALYPNNKRIFLAPTGRAAQIMTSVTGERALTIQSFLKLYEEEEETDVIEDNALFVVDEVSMMDEKTAHILFKAIGKNCTVALVGDIDQLPSVGAGAVLRDIIESGVIPVVRLLNVYRQGEDTKIWENAKNIKSGITELKEGSDFHMIECHSMQSIQDKMVEIYVKEVRKYGLLNVSCLCPYIEHLAGVNQMNALIQNVLNPISDDMVHVEANHMDFRVGDVVMQQRKNTPDAVNGDIGIIDHISWNDDEEYEIYVKMATGIVRYTHSNINLLTLAYAMSIHKAQGMEVASVVTCLSSFHKGMLFMNIPYVAVSRGKKNVTIVGEQSALKQAITNKSGNRRVTLLGYFLAYLGGKFVEL